MNICHMHTRRLEQLRCAPPSFPAKARPALPSATHEGPRVVGEWKEGVLGAMGPGQGVNPDPADNN